MRLYPNLFRLIVVCCLASFSYHTHAQTTTSEWKRYGLGKGNFSVLFPDQPKEDFKPSPSLETPIDLYIYSVSTAEGSLVAQYGALGTAAETWTESGRDAFYDGVWDGASIGFDKEMEANNLSHRSKLVEKRAIRFSGHPGREVSFTIGPWSGRIWMTVMGRRSFGAMVVGSDKLSTADRERFLNSFIIKPASTVEPAATK